MKKRSEQRALPALPPTGPVTRRPLPWLIITAVLVSSCNGDAPTTVRVRPSDITPRADILPATSAYDPGINTNDTWVTQVQTVVESTTVSSTQPFDDPVTGAPVTSTTVSDDPQNVNVMAGYGYDGQIRITTGFQQTDGSETVWSQNIGDAETDLFGSGAPNTQMLENDPMSQLGSLVYAQIDPDVPGANVPPPPPPPPDPNDPCATAIDPTMCYAVSRVPSSGAQLPFGAQRSPSATARPLRGNAANAPRIFDISPTLRRVVLTIPGEVQQDLIAPLAAKSVRRSLTAASGALAAQSNAETPTWTHQVTTDYEKHNDKWVVKHVMYETFVKHSQGNARHAMHLTVLSQQYHRNPELDAQRARLRAQMNSATTNSRVSGKRPTTVASLDATTCDATIALIPCNDPTYGSPSYSSDPPAPDQTVVIPGAFHDVGSSGKTIVLQHGFFSDNRTWGRMRGWLKTDMVYAGLEANTTTWPNTYEDQAVQLNQDLSGRISPQGAVLIGHSNGGMISRTLARNPSIGGLAPANVSGVITIGTPHWGAPLAKHLRSINRLFRWGGDVAILLCAWTDTAGCQSFQYISNSTLANIFTSLAGNVPVLNEMQPNSSYHSTVNSLSEASFTKFGISSYLWTKWYAWRLFGDAYCYEDSSCGGSHQVVKIDKTFHHDIKCSIVGGLTFNWSRAAKCAADAVFLRAVDNLYAHWTYYLGDGIVPSWSQQYPNIPSTNLFVINDGPSHLGETSDKRVGQRVENLLNARFGVPQVAYTPGPPLP